MDVDVSLSSISLSFIYFKYVFSSPLTLFCCILGEYLNLIFQLTNYSLAVSILLVIPSMVFFILLPTFSIPSISTWFFSVDSLFLLVSPLFL